MIQFDEGGRMMIDFTDVDEGKVEVGMPMRMMFRIKEHGCGPWVRALFLEGGAGHRGMNDRD